MLIDSYFRSHRIIGAIVSLSPEYCFVVCDDQGVCGYALASLNAVELRQKTEVSWIPAMYQKYPKPSKEELTPSEVRTPPLPPQTFSNSE